MPGPRTPAHPSSREVSKLALPLAALAMSQASELLPALPPEMPLLPKEAMVAPDQQLLPWRPRILRPDKKDNLAGYQLMRQPQPGQQTSTFQPALKTALLLLQDTGGE